MATATQTDRPMKVQTPLGEDVMLLAGFSGQEGLSQLFSYHLDLLVENETKEVPKEIAFDQLLGQAIIVSMQLAGGQEERPFGGICSRISQGETSESYTEYRMEIVPPVWLLTRRIQSRIFQHESIVGILKKVFEGLDVDYNNIQGTFHPRDYCVQYRESDFSFACRLMEEEGIYYYFKHSSSGCQMVLANTPAGHEDIPERAEIEFGEYGAGGPGGEEVDRIYDWVKSQEVRSGKYTLWDYCFEKPTSHLDASKEIQSSVDVGVVTHKLSVANNSLLEVYDFPGEYAQRFDGVDKGGGERPSEIEKIFEDNGRTVGIRMQEEASASLLIMGGSNVRQMTSGHKFTLSRHIHADGEYVLTSVTHTARDQSYVSGDSEDFSYQNSFTCTPSALPFRPPRRTARPVVQGSQTAMVVGPAGEEIFTDKYGRVKVQFSWDRAGKNDADSSCWIRVGTLWAGKNWGVIHIPRIGQEVIVDFLEGDPDQPIIVGSVYNAETMPPYALPDNKTQSGVKSRSSLNGSPDNFNEIRFEDLKGEEQLFIHAEKNQDIEVENDETHWVGHNRTKTIDNDEVTHVKHDRTETVDNNETITIKGHRKEEVKKSESIIIGESRNENVGKNETITIEGNRSESVGKDEKITISGGRTESVGKDESVSIDGARSVNVDKDDRLNVKKNLSISAKQNINMAADGKVGQRAEDVFVVQSEKEITLKCGKAKIIMKKNGDIIIDGGKINMKGSGKVTIKGSQTAIN